MIGELFILIEVITKTLKEDFVRHLYKSRNIIKVIVQKVKNRGINENFYFKLGFNY